MKPDPKIEILKNCSFLSGAENHILSDLADATHNLKIAGGETVLTKGDSGSTMYFIASGKVRVHDGEVVLATLGTGEVFGEMAALDADVRSASVTAETETVPCRGRGCHQHDLTRL